MPTFNSAGYVEESIRSILAQSESDFELIVADDGSTDGTPERVKRLAAKDRRIVICPPSRTGSSGAARNRGLARARGDYIAFLDDDDLYLPEKIRQTAGVLDAFPEIDIAFHDYVSFTGSPNGELGDLRQAGFTGRAVNHLREAGDGVYLCDEHFYVFMSVRNIPFHTSALMFRRKLLDSGDLHFREDLRVSHDIELWLRLAKEYRIAFLNRVLSCYRRRSGSLTADRVVQIRDSIQVHTENLQRNRDHFTHEEVRICQSNLAGKLFDLGYTYFCGGDRQEARVAYRESMNIGFRMRTAWAYCKTLVPEFLVRVQRRRAVSYPQVHHRK